MRHSAKLDDAGAPAERWWRSSLGLSAIGFALWWAALPPLSLAPLVFLAPVGWGLLIRQPALPGRRPYLALWLSSFIFWLVTLYWLTLPHWATSIGWVALSFYLAFYFPAFMALSRVAVHGCGVSTIVAAPVVWTGLELARSHMLGGFAMGSLPHGLFRWPMLLQIADLAGAYGVGSVIILVGACLARAMSWGGLPRAWWPLALAAGALVAVGGYGYFRLAQQTTEPGPKVALIQGSIDIELKYDRAQAQKIYDEYLDLSRRAVRENAGLDLIVWPETMFRDPWYEFDPGVETPADVGRSAQQVQADSRRAIELTVAPLGVPCLIGIDGMRVKRDGFDHFNTALATDRLGNVTDRYDKIHLVIFGEYVPFADHFPWLYHLTPLPSSTRSGNVPKSFRIGDARYAPSICYENTIPQLIRSQVVELRDEGQEPDVLVNLTNDGWFWGSTELDLHLACSVFRAIECRKPFLVAANTGFSAWVDSRGAIRAQGPRRATDVIVADTQIDRRRSPYLAVGDVPAGVCLLGCAVLTIIGIAQRRRRPKPPVSPVC